MATTNVKTGLPARVDAKNPAELQQALDRLLEVVGVLNGERGTADQRAVTRGELQSSALKNPNK